MSEPVRTCVACRQPAAKRALLRLVWDPVHGRIVRDPTARRPGRGAYLHDTAQCWQLAIRRRAVPRALRLQGAAASAEQLAELACVREVGIELSGASGRPGRSGEELQPGSGQ